MKTKSSMTKTTNSNTLTGRFRTACAARLLLLSLLLLPAVVQAQFNYFTYNDFNYMTNSDNTITIIGYNGSNTDLTIPGSILVNDMSLPVISIGGDAFYNCTMGSVTIPNSVTYIGDYGFADCGNLGAVYLEGNAPSVGLDVFDGDYYGPPTEPPAPPPPYYPIAYYQPGTTGWGMTFGGLTTMLWNPQAQNDASFGVQTNQFGFNITGTSGLTIVVEACTNLVNAAWIPLQTNTLSAGPCYFSDPGWTNYPCRFYRFRSPTGVVPVRPVGE
jgi:hypothetical protein